MSCKKGDPIRKCVMTNNRLLKTELLRVVRVGDDVIFDEMQNILGRGAYITPSVSIIEKAKKKNAFARSLRTKVDLSVYDELLKILMEAGIDD